MDLNGTLSKFTRSGMALSLLTLSVAALFKMAAFGREAFIASRFGLTSFTDAYFAFAQFPLILSAFMFGAFGLAFAPAYANQKRAAGHVDWLPALTIYASGLGLLLTVAMSLLTRWLLNLFSIAVTTQNAATLVILSCSFLPVIWLGLWAGVTIAEGKNLRAMFVTGLPYLLMAVLLVGLYGIGRLNSLSLPFSFLAGFGVVGGYTLLALISTQRVSPPNQLSTTQECPLHTAGKKPLGDIPGWASTPARSFTMQECPPQTAGRKPLGDIPGLASTQAGSFTTQECPRPIRPFYALSSTSFRRFLNQLSASSAENLGYSANQLLLVYFIAHTGTGEVSANSCAMRIGMLGFSLLSQPLAQLMQAKLCAGRVSAQAVLRQWLPAIAAAVIVFAALLYALRVPVAGAVYLHGNFSVVELNEVTEIVPAWAAYFVVASLNAFLARYLFSNSQGYLYVRRQLFAYAAANLIRLLCWGRLSASAVIWCSVLCEACSLLVNLCSCFAQTRSARLEPVMAGAQEA